jgi:hypothetical protein
MKVAKSIASSPLSQTGAQTSAEGGGCRVAAEGGEPRLSGCRHLIAREAPGKRRRIGHSSGDWWRGGKTPTSH